MQGQTRGRGCLAWAFTTKGKSQEVPEPVVRSAMVVGPARDGIQKKPSVNKPCTQPGEQPSEGRGGAETGHTEVHVAKQAIEKW